MNIALVVIGYNRPHALKRLLASLNAAHYGAAKPDLIISLDHNSDASALNVAESFEYAKGKKTVKMQPKRLGLREHVMACGDLSQNYDGIVLLEDDIYVSPYFYRYVEQAMQKYVDCEAVAGISLYKFEWNQHALQPFYPINNGTDAFFMQCAQSWGQAWSQKMWAGFKNWYLENQTCFDVGADSLAKANMPDNILQHWPTASSWLKFFTRYIIDQNYYFVFPYVALSTNFGDVGVHAVESGTGYQVEMLYGEKKYDFPEFDETALKYDVFLENQTLHTSGGLKSIEGITAQNLCVDLYGINPNKRNYRYWLSPTTQNYKILKMFGRKMRPHDANVLCDIAGDDIFLYDTSVQALNKSTKKQIRQRKKRRILFDIRETYWKELVFLLKLEMLSGIRRVMCRAFKTKKKTA